MPSDMADWHPGHGDPKLGLEPSLGTSRNARYAHNRMEERGQYHVCCCAMIGHRPYAARNRSDTCSGQNPRSVDGSIFLCSNLLGQKLNVFFCKHGQKKTKAQMINWALDTISKEALWVLVIAAVIVMVAFVSRWR